MNVGWVGAWKEDARRRIEDAPWRDTRTLPAPGYAPLGEWLIHAAPAGGRSCVYIIRTNMIS
jgi:hypothetical protein